MDYAGLISLHNGRITSVVTTFSRRPLKNGEEVVGITQSRTGASIELVICKLPVRVCVTTQDVIHHVIRNNSLYFSHHTRYTGGIIRSIALFIGCLLTIILQDCKQHQDTAGLLQRYIQVANRHDISALRTKFAEDIVWILGPDTLIGKDAVIKPHEFDAGAGTRLIVKSSIAKGDTVESVLEETNDYMDTLGIPSIVHYARFVFRGDLLTRIEPIRPGLTPSTADSIDRLWNHWIQSTHPEAWAQIVKPNGGINFSRQNGELLLRLAHEWKQSRGK